MPKSVEMVKEFHDKVVPYVRTRPVMPSPREAMMRVHLLQEEVSELALGIADDDLMQVLDALVDIQYVLDGAFLAFGMGEIKEEAFRRVHESNMTKFVNGEALLSPGGRVGKGPDYQPPQLYDLLVLGV